MVLIFILIAIWFVVGVASAVAYMVFCEGEDVRTNDLFRLGVCGLLGFIVPIYALVEIYSSKTGKVLIKGRKRG